MRENFGWLSRTLRHSFRTWTLSTSVRTTGCQSKRFTVNVRGGQFSLDAVGGRDTTPVGHRPMSRRQL